MASPKGDFHFTEPRAFGRPGRPIERSDEVWLMSSPMPKTSRMYPSRHRLPRLLEGALLAALAATLSLPLQAQSPEERVELERFRDPVGRPLTP